jgi:hypothetical protein
LPNTSRQFTDGVAATIVGLIVVYVFASSAEQSCLSAQGYECFLGKIFKLIVLSPVAAVFGVVVAGLAHTRWRPDRRQR